MVEVSGGSLVCEWVARKSQAGAPPLWCPQLISRTRAGHRNPVTIVTVGLFKNGGSLGREPRL
eukprot:514949-Pyramimonas_sp.AAC.1